MTDDFEMTRDGSVLFNRKEMVIRAGSQIEIRHNTNGAHHLVINSQIVAEFGICPCCGRMTI